MLVPGMLSVPLVSGFATESTKTFTVVLVAFSTQAVVTPTAAEVCVLVAVFDVNGMVTVELIRLTVRASGRLALMVTVPVLEFNCAAAGMVARATAMIASAVVAKTFVENLIVVSYSFAFRKCGTTILRLWRYRTKDK